MIVWAGCMTCREDPLMHKWVGFWVQEEAFGLLTPADVHGRSGYDDHELYPYTLDDWIPREQTEQDLTYQAEYADFLEEAGLLYPLATFAALTGQRLYNVDYRTFLRRYAGEWEGRPTRAARKRFYFLPAGPHRHYLVRRSEPRSEAVRRAVQV